MRIHVSFDADNYQNVAVGFSGVDSQHAPDVSIDKAIETLTGARSALASIRCALECLAPIGRDIGKEPTVAPKARKAKR